LEWGKLSKNSIITLSKQVPLFYDEKRNPFFNQFVRLLAKVALLKKHHHVG